MIIVLLAVACTPMGGPGSGKDTGNESASEEPPFVPENGTFWFQAQSELEGDCDFARLTDGFERDVVTYLDSGEMLVLQSQSGGAFNCRLENDLTFECDGGSDRGDFRDLGYDDADWTYTESASGSWSGPSLFAFTRRGIYTCEGDDCAQAGWYDCEYWKEFLAAQM